MTQEEKYRELISEIIKSKVKIFGELAIKKVESINSLTLDSAGNVTSLSGEPVATLRQVLKKFEEISGVTSTILAKNVIRLVKKKYPDLVIPEDISP